jgi:hypothetical protein
MNEIRKILNRLNHFKYSTIPTIFVCCTLFLFVVGTMEAIPKTVGERTVNIDQPMEERGILFASYYRGQTFKITIDVSEEVNINIWTSYHNSLMIILFNETVSGSTEVSLTIPHIGSLLAISAQSLDKPVVIYVKMTLQGYPSDAKNGVIIGIVISIMSMLVLRYLRMKKIKPDKKFIEGTKNPSFWTQCKILIKMEIAAYNTIGFVISILFLFMALEYLPRALLFPTESDRVCGEFRCDDPVYSFDLEVWNLLVHIARPLFYFVSFALALVFFNRMWEEDQPSLWVETNYLSAPILSKTIRIFVLSFYLFLIPLFLFLMNIYNTIDDNSMSLNPLAVVFVIFLTYLLLLGWLVFYFVLYELIPNRGFRLIAPFFLLIITKNPLLKPVDRVAFFRHLNKIVDLDQITEVKPNIQPEPVYNVLQLAFQTLIWVVILLSLLFFVSQPLIKKKKHKLVEYTKQYFSSNHNKRDTDLA